MYSNVLVRILYVYFVYFVWNIATGQNWDSTKCSYMIVYVCIARIYMYILYSTYTSYCLYMNVYTCIVCVVCIQLYMYVFECIRTYIVCILCPSFFCTYRPVFACIRSYMKVFLLVTFMSCVRAFTPKTRINVFIRKYYINSTSISIKNTNCIRTYTIIYGCPFAPKPVGRPDFHHPNTYVYCLYTHVYVRIIRSYMSVYICIGLYMFVWASQRVLVQGIRTYTKYTGIYVRNIRTLYVRIRTQTYTIVDKRICLYIVCICTYIIRILSICLYIQKKKYRVQRTAFIAN